MNATGEDIVKHLPMELIDWFKDTTLVIVKHGGQVEGYQFTMYPSLEEPSNYTVVNVTLNTTAPQSDNLCNHTCNCTNATKHDEEIVAPAAVEPHRNLTLDELLDQIQHLVPNATIDRSHFSINITLIEQNFTDSEPEAAPDSQNQTEEDYVFQAKEGGSAKCYGHVRYGYAATNTWSKDFPIEGKYKCNNAKFGDVKAGWAKECQCKQSDDTSSFGIDLDEDEAEDCDKNDDTPTTTSKTGKDDYSSKAYMTVKSYAKRYYSYYSGYSYKQTYFTPGSTYNYYSYSYTPYDYTYNTYKNSYYSYKSPASYYYSSPTTYTYSYDSYYYYEPKVYTSYSPAYSYSYYGKKYKKNKGRKWKDEVKDFI